MSWGRIEWSMSTIVASGSTVRIAPFIAPMYSPAPKSVVNVTIALIRSTPSAQASQALFDSGEFLLSSGELGIRLRRAGLAVLQLRFPCLEGGLGRLQRNPLGSDSIALRGQFREAFLEALALRADGLLPSLPVRLRTRHALFRRGFTVFDLVDTMRQALLSFPERRLLRLELAFARFDCGFPALDLLFGLGLATHDGVGPLFELLGLLCVRSLGLRQRRLPRLDVLQIREERGLLLLQRGLQRLDRLRFLRDGSLRRGDLALALFDFGLLGGVFLFERGPSGSQVPFDDLGRVGPFLGSLFDGRGGLLAFLDRGLPAFRRRLPLVQVTFGRLDCPEPQLRGPLGPKQLDGLRLQLRAIRGELLVHPFEPTLQLVERLPAGREISLSPPDVDLSLPRFETEATCSRSFVSRSRMAASWAVRRRSRRSASWSRSSNTFRASEIFSASACKFAYRSFICFRSRSRDEARESSDVSRSRYVASFDVSSRSRPPSFACRSDRLRR